METQTKVRIALLAYVLYVALAFLSAGCKFTERQSYATAELSYHATGQTIKVLCLADKLNEDDCHRAAVYAEVVDNALENWLNALKNGESVSDPIKAFDLAMGVLLDIEAKGDGN